MSELSPLSGVKRKSYFRAAKTVFDPYSDIGERVYPSMIFAAGCFNSLGVLLGCHFGCFGDFRCRNQQQIRSK